MDTLILALLLGVGFGFVLESSGFGDSRRLAAQFYLTEMRVLKVMFTAIVTCMLLLVWAWGLGWLDFEGLSINPTYLGSGLLGGLLLGFGFIIGGYCPGTSIVSAATLKVDGAIFLGGVGAGTLLFGETGGAYRTFYDNAGYLGRFTLPEWLGLSPGEVAVLVVLMAAFMFWGAEKLERIFGPQRAQRPPVKRVLRPAMRAGGILGLVVATLILTSPAVGQSPIDTRLERLAPDLDRTIEGRSVHIDPAELLELMHNRIQGKRSRLHLVLLDLRGESDYNLFHLEDAVRVTPEQLRGEIGRRYAGNRFDTSIKVCMSNDEAAAEEGWSILQAQGALNCYVLSGGINLWLDVFSGEAWNARAGEAKGAGPMRHSFPSALGARYPFARPGHAVLERMEGLRRFERNILPVVDAPEPTAGCG